LTVVLSLFASGSVPADYTAVVHGRVIDGTGTDPIQDGVVLMEDDRIAGVFRWNDAALPEGTKVIDLSGKTVLPGIIDAHVHSSASPSVRRTFLEAGVTSVCDLGSPIESMPEFLITRDSGNLAARGFRAGPIITIPDGMPDALLHTNLNYEAGTPEEAKACVENLVKNGADVIKIYLEPWGDIAMLTTAQVKAIVKEAHANGLLVRAHVSKLAALDTALEGGVDVIEHVPKPALSSEAIGKALSGSSNPLDDLFDMVVVPEYETVLPRMIEAKVILVPTLTRGLGRYYGNPEATEIQQVLAKGVIEIVRRFHELGGVIAFGTDYYAEMPGVPGKMHRREIELLHAAGLSPMEIITSFSKHAARVVGRESDLGTLEKGKLADLLVVSGDPLSDLSALAKVDMVIQGGEIAYRSAP
jgi:imidazolonepropionase-like amidohydrolase